MKPSNKDDKLESLEHDKWEFDINTPYEITIRPFKQDPDMPLRFTNACSDLRNLTKKLSPKFLLFPELSQPKYNLPNKPMTTLIHWHGIIQFFHYEELYEFLLTGWNTLQSLYKVQINPYREDYWLKYCTKQQKFIPKVYRIISARMYKLYLKEPLPAIEGAPPSAEPRTTVRSEAQIII